MDRSELSTEDPFVEKLAAIPTGFSTGVYRGQPYKILHSVQASGRIEKLFGESLQGSDHISFNLYRLSCGRILLKPCEMSAQKVKDFVLHVKLIPREA